MTGRDISSDLSDELDKKAIRYTVLAYFNFTDGAQYFWAGPRGESITWDGQTWAGLGDLGEIDRIGEPGDLRASRTVASLRVSTSMLSDVQDDGEANRGRAAEIRLLFFDNDNSFLDEIVFPFEMGGTRAETARTIDDIGSVIVQEVIKMNLLGRQDLLSRKLFRRQTHTDTLEINSDDYGNEFASDPDLGTLGFSVKDTRTTPLPDPRRPRFRVP